MLTRDVFTFPADSFPGMSIDSFGTFDGIFPTKLNISPYYLGCNQTYCRSMTMGGQVTFGLDDLEKFSKAAVSVEVVKKEER